MEQLSTAIGLRLNFSTRNLTYKENLLMSEVEDVCHSCNVRGVEADGRLMTVGIGAVVGIDGTHGSLL